MPKVLMIVGVLSMFGCTAAAQKEQAHATLKVR